MSFDEKMEMLEEVMDLESDELKPEALLADMEEWDSLSKLALMAEVKKEFGKKLSAEEIMDFETVQDILDYLG